MAEKMLVIHLIKLTGDRNANPAFGQSHITNMESSGEISLLKNAEMANRDQGVSRAVMVANSTTVTAVDNAATGINQTISFGKAKIQSMENAIAGNSSPENVEARDTEDGSGSGSDMHIWDLCSKSFEKISSLNGHMGSH